MSDKSLSSAKRNAKIEEGSSNAQVEFLLELLRQSRLRTIDLEIAAYCGNEAARAILVDYTSNTESLSEEWVVQYKHAEKMLPGGVLPSSKFGNWILGLEKWGKYYSGLAVLFAADLCIPSLQRELKEADWLANEYEIARNISRLEVGEQVEAISKLKKLRNSNLIHKLPLLESLKNSSIVGKSAYCSIALSISEALSLVQFQCSEYDDYKPNLLPIWAAVMATGESTVKKSISSRLTSLAIGAFNSTPNKS